MKLDRDKVIARMKAVDINTLGHLAQAIDVEAPTLSRYFSGEYKPSWEKQAAMCRVLRCTVDDIVTYDNGN